MVAKDVTVNWKMFGDFKANKTFYTDSNAMQMQERRVVKLPRTD